MLADESYEDVFHFISRLRLKGGGGLNSSSNSGSKPATNEPFVL